MKRLFVAAVATTGILFAAAANAEEKEPTAIFEIGAAGNWTAPSTASLGPTVAVEFTPIKDWLEIEIGTGPLFASGMTDWSTDILFKKPFTLSDTAELMVGAGPAFDLRSAAQRRSEPSLPSISCSGRGRTENTAGS